MKTLLHHPLKSAVKPVGSAIILLTLMLSGCAQNQDQGTPDSPETMGNSTINPQSSEQGISVDDPWIRPAAEGSTTAAYLQITNNNTEPDTLLSVTSGISSRIEIHEAFEQEGMMGMREIAVLNIPGESSVHLEPGGLHLMIMNLNQELSADNDVELTLHFAQRGDQSVTVPIRQNP